MKKQKTKAQLLKSEIVSKTNLKAREISVTGSNCGYSSAINIEVKNERFPLSVVEKIANQYESIDRCEITHEILEGGNLYVDVSYKWDLEISEEFEAEILKVIQPAKELDLPSDWCILDKNQMRTRKACQVLGEHLNTDSELEYTDSDLKAIMGQIDHSKLW